MIGGTPGGPGMIGGTPGGPDMIGGTPGGPDSHYSQGRTPHPDFAF